MVQPLNRQCRQSQFDHRELEHSISDMTDEGDAALGVCADTIGAGETCCESGGGDAVSWPLAAALPTATLTNSARLANHAAGVLMILNTVRTPFQCQLASLSCESARESVEIGGRGNLHPCSLRGIQ